MAVPRAQPSGIFGSGYQPAAARPVDYGQIIDAAVGGASSLVQGAYLRKVAERNAAIAQQTRDAAAAQHAFENNQSTLRETRETARDQWEREKSQRDFDLRERELEAKRAESGIQPATATPMTSLPGLPDATIRTPEQYNPQQDMTLQRGLALRAKPPAETQGTPEHLKAVADEATARAGAVARFRAPAASGLADQVQQAAAEAWWNAPSTPEVRDKASLMYKRMRVSHPDWAPQQIMRSVHQAMISSDQADNLQARTQKLEGGADQGGQLVMDAEGNMTLSPGAGAPTPAAAPSRRPAPLRTPGAGVKPPVIAPLSTPRPQASAPTAAEGAMSDADLWEHKRTQGFTTAEATDYVKGRKKAAP